ncbi:succinylglutamate desuccinylase/aspartoacylase family protein [Candidatus Sumerlaeota bacterium]|nr:succinylglutamate desuccinylase/aspartoacylase family protein [Candidatus Sumerlaeota bacterium]
MTNFTFETDFEAGNGESFQQIGPDAYSFAIRPDTKSEDRQWFYFRVRGAAGRTVRFQLNGISATNVPEHWELSRPVASRDGGRTWRWTSGGTAVDPASDSFSFTHHIQSDAELIAYHFPYGFEKFEGEMRRWASHEDALHSIIGKSVQGRPIHYLRVETGTAPKEIGVWVCARVHSAETTASFTMEGFLDFLLSDDPRALELRERAVIHVVPLVNPDGVVAGNYRDNIEGINLNRVWDAPTQETSPEILAVRRVLDEWADARNPYQLFIDFHSDSSAKSHYAFYPDGSAPTPLYHTPGDYHAHILKFLRFVAEEAPDFCLDEGASTASDPGLSFHLQRMNRGVLALIPEGSYGLLQRGPNAGRPITPRDHRIVGAAFALAIWKYYLA